MKTFKDLQEIITNEDIYIFYDNDFWEFRRYPMNMELTEEQDRNCIIAYSDDIDFSTFPKNQLYYGNQYGNGIMVLLANTPNHRIKGVRVA
ncbi:MAG: hypothetical protein LBK94_12610 [Prevotellaceae bacterium]|jgi:hypothetical protein|nr:hypothetical protein [Prevotellaceae bacterium]